MAADGRLSLTQVWQVKADTVAMKKSGIAVQVAIKWHPQTVEVDGKTFAKLCKWDKVLLKLVWSRSMKMDHALEDDDIDYSTLNCSFVDDLLKLRNTKVCEAVFHL